MSDQGFSPEFKDEAVRQVVERGYRVAGVAARPGCIQATKNRGQYGHERGTTNIRIQARRVGATRLFNLRSGFISLVILAGGKSQVS